MISIKQIYKCNICGNIVEVVHAGQGQLVCCGQPMELKTEKNKDIGNEKHVQLITVEANSILVKVGSVPHPMEQAHYLEWIELVDGGKSYRQFLNPLDKPETEFKIGASNKNKLVARDYCNVYGLWKS